MAALRADKKNYKKAFTTHANSYDKWNIGSDYSRRLLLCYCVECGLKCLIMQINNINTISQADEETARILHSHDFKILLNKVKQAGNYKLKQFATEYGETVRPSDYHQLCRYLIAPFGQKISYLEEFDNTLIQIKGKRQIGSYGISGRRSKEYWLLHYYI